jgi:hypothetical protein
MQNEKRFEVRHHWIPPQGRGTVESMQMSLYAIHSDLQRVGSGVALDSDGIVELSVELFSIAQGLDGLLFHTDIKDSCATCRYWQRSRRVGDGRAPCMGALAFNGEAHPTEGLQRCSAYRPRPGGWSGGSNA